MGKWKGEWSPPNESEIVPLCIEGGGCTFHSLQNADKYLFLFTLTAPMCVKTIQLNSINLGRHNIVYSIQSTHLTKKCRASVVLPTAECS